MVIIVKNPTLRRRVFKSVRRYENLALKSYAKGNIKQGNKHEKKADKLYSKNYHKMFKIVRKK